MDAGINTPLVSAVMITYNGEKFIDKAIDSVLNQTYKNFELLILDDDSNDNTGKIAKLRAEKDSRIKYFKNEKNRGLSFSRNKIVKLAKGDFIAVTDSDDISFPERFKIQVEFLLANPGVKIVGSAITLMDDEGKIFETWGYPLKAEEIKIGLKTSCEIANPSSMFARELFFDINGYDENLQICEDWDFFYRAAAKFELENMAEPLIYYRVHNNNISKNKLDHTIIYSICLKHDLEKKFLKTTIQQFASLYPGFKKELAQKTIKFYSFWIDIYCKLGYKKLSGELYLHVINNLFVFFDKPSMKIFLRNSLIIYIRQRNYKMLWVASKNYLFK